MGTHASCLTPQNLRHLFGTDVELAPVYVKKIYIVVFSKIAVTRVEAPAKIQGD